MKECPYCGSEEYYIKQRMAGSLHYYMRLDGNKIENGDMHQNLSYKTTSKFAWCSNCDKRLFKLSEDIST